MADKYVDVSLSTGLNDGSSTANAWQSLVEVLKNTQAAGTVTAGDTIHVRTHDGTSDLSEAFTAKITVATPTGTTPKRTEFVFDNGTVWANGGVFTLSTTGAYYVRFTKNVNIFAYSDGTRRFTVLSNYIAGSVYIITVLSGAIYDGITLQGGSTSSTNASFYVAAESGSTVHQSVSIAKNILFKYETTGLSRPLVHIPGYASLVLINPVFDMSLDFKNVSDGRLFEPYSYGSTLQVQGGKIINGWENLQLLKMIGGTKTTTKMTFKGFKTASTVYDYEKMLSSDTTPEDSTFVSVLGFSDDFDTVYIIGGIVCEYRASNNQPTLNAVLPDGANTPWSYMVHARATKAGVISKLPSLEKIHTGTSGIKTFTVEMLLNDNLGSALSDVLWAEISYTDDATGLTVTESTFTRGGSLTASTASWTALTYGANSYSRYKLELTSASSVKAYSKVYVQIFCGIERVALTDFFFVDPDIGIA